MKWEQIGWACGASLVLLACGSEQRHSPSANGGAMASSSSRAGNASSSAGGAEATAGGSAGNDPARAGGRNANLGGIASGGVAGSNGAGRGGEGGIAEVTNVICESPHAPVLVPIHANATLVFTPPNTPLEVGTADDPAATEPDEWRSQNSLKLPSSGSVKVFARVALDDCDVAPFEQLYEVTAAYPGPVGDDTTTAIPLDDPSISGWATGVEHLELGAGSTNETFQDPELLLGPAEASATDIVALGDEGRVTLTFSPPITNGAGADFAVFENGFSDSFLELAFIEVSSDGETFARFDTAYLGETALGAFDEHSTTLIGGIAGKYRQGFGQPYDLELLTQHAEVRSGDVDLGRITHVRVVDIPGDGSVVDSFGNVIYDPYPTQGTAGFDLDAIAVLNAAD